MIKLNYSIKNEYLEFDKIVNSKKDSVILKSIRTRVLMDYRLYLENISSLHRIKFNKYNSIEGESLKKCYSNGTNALSNLKAELISCQEVKFQYLCPYCLISNYSTFDHYIPKENNPSLSVLAKNLIPSCNVCNSKKKEYWRDETGRGIIHFYEDDVNIEQFLFCSLKFCNNLPIFEFYLNTNKITNIQMKNMVEKHFERLELINRYNIKAADIIGDIILEFQSFNRTNIDNCKFVGLLKSKSIEFKKNYGRNYFVALIYYQLSASQEFSDLILNKVDNNV